MKVRLLEVLLSIPLSACIVSVVWFGFMQQFFDIPLPADEGIFFQTGSSAHVQGSSTIFKPTKIATASSTSSKKDIAMTTTRIGVVPEQTRNEMPAPEILDLERTIQAFLDINSTRKNFGKALGHVKASGNAIEVGSGAGRGNFADVILQTWTTPKYYIVDSNVNSEQDLPANLQRHFRDGRVEVVNEYMEDAATRFPNDHFSFIYINPSSSFRGLKKDLEDWFPKLQDGGLLAGKDYCASHNEKSSPQHIGHFSNKPWCGTYQGGNKAGKEKAGFGKYTVRSVDQFAEEVGRNPHFTLEGRKKDDPFESDGLANPSWWLIK
eukprot:CAMPEP_0114242698 /NCGR_PEP_ID=MMETSP0058-20121206/10325_1 /TAXON_ID=36894 /ORGANISM="Pyramimonas parkeae, CCMP726" /LENGTH=321 /DNA_ID=CAMNT_0001355349 /DNA_START=232 /DNA_END=1197 /DNA_ORIENTATION=-